MFSTIVDIYSASCIVTDLNHCARDCTRQGSGLNTREIFDIDEIFSTFYRRSVDHLLDALLNVLDLKQGFRSSQYSSVYISDF